MDPAKDTLSSQHLEIDDQAQQPWLRLSREDIARLSAKREELIMVLRLWHGYGRMQADRVISTWLYDHGQGRSDLAWQTLSKRNPKPPMQPDA